MRFSAPTPAPRAPAWLVGVVLWCACLPASAPPARAQEAVVDSVRAAYQRLAYDVAETRARAALAGEALRLDQRTELHTLLAIIAFTQNEVEAARRAFNLALDLTPDLQLDPLLVSPKILAFFDEVKQTRRPVRPEGEGEAEANLRYVVVRDVRTDAALRSMLLPGWGQLYKGETVKGWTLAGLFGGGAAASAYAHLRWLRARDAYLEEGDPDLIASQYRTADAWFKVRNNLAVGVAGVWLVSYVDALLHGPPAPPRTARLSVLPGPDRLGLRVAF